MSHTFPRSRNDDRAISPVIGTILMVAATVIIAGAVYAAVNAYSGRNSKPPVDASWKAQSLDTNGDGLDDMVKVTYLSGPTTVAGSQINVNATTAAGLALVSGGIPPPASWDPGDYATYKISPAPAGATTVYVTISQAGSTVLDQTLTLRG